LVGLNRDNPQLHDVYRLDLVSGELVKEVENPGFVGWVADAELVVRCGIAPQPDGGVVVMIRDGAGQDWRPLLTVAAEDALTSQPIAFSADGGSLLAMSSVGANTSRLVRIDLASGAAQVLAEDPEADVTGVRLHPDTREPQIVIFLKERSHYLALDPACEPDLAAIRALHPGDPAGGDGDDDDRVWLVGFTNDTGPVPFYGEHQAGIATPAQDRLAFAAFDITTTDAQAVQTVLGSWAAAASRMTAGEAIGPTETAPQAPPVDTGEAFDLGPAGLTVTVGFGPSFFDDRFGLAGKRPAALADLPALPGDALDPARSNGDLCVQACANDPQVAFHVIRNFARIGRGTVVMRWSQLGFGRTSATSIA